MRRGQVEARPCAGAAGRQRPACPHQTQGMRHATLAQQGRAEPVAGRLYLICAHGQNDADPAPPHRLWQGAAGARCGPAHGRSAEGGGGVAGHVFFLGLAPPLLRAPLLCLNEGSLLQRLEWWERCEGEIVSVSVFAVSDPRPPGPLPSFDAPVQTRGSRASVRQPPPPQRMRGARPPPWAPAVAPARRAVGPAAPGGARGAPAAWPWTPAAQRGPGARLQARRSPRRAPGQRPWAPERCCPPRLQRGRAA